MDRQYRVYPEEFKLEALFLHGLPPGKAFDL